MSIIFSLIHFLGNRFETNFSFLHHHRVNPNLKDSIYCVALREGGPQEWNYALKRYRETTSASEKEVILNALGCTTKPWLLSK